MDNIQPVRGTSDLLPAEKAKHNYVIEHAKQGAGQFGYADMSTPIFEFTDVFSRPLALARMWWPKKPTALKIEAARVLPCALKVPLRPCAPLFPTG